MDLKQALQQRGGGNGSNNNITHNHSNSNTHTHNTNNKSSANSIQSDGGNNSSCSNNNSTNTGESNRGSSPVAAPLLSCGGPFLNNNSRISPVSHLTRARSTPNELDAHDPRLLKFARLHDPPSPHSSSLETQVLFNLNGTFNNSSNNNNNNNAAAHHHALSSYLSNSNHSSNHGSPTSNYAGSNTCSLFNGGGSPHSKLYPFASLHEDAIRQHHSSYMLSAVSAPQAALLSSVRAHHAALPCFNPEPVASLFTPEQLLEFTQQTYVFKHFVAGVTPPPTLLLPIINSVASMGRMGVGSMHFGSNAGLFGVGGLRGNIDPEPGRCRRTDGKKWRCAREVVADQKYCERHMHRGRHRARANKLANGGADTLNPSSNLPPNAVSNTTNAHASGGINSTSVPTPFVSSAPKVEPHLHFSLQPASAASTQLNRSNSACDNNNNQKQALDAAGGLKRLLESNNIGGPLARSLAAHPENPPNLAELLKANSCAKSSCLTNHNNMPKTQNNNNNNNNMGLDSPFPFSCQSSDRDADSLALRQYVDGEHWPRISRVAADNPPPSSLSWFDQLAEEQNKRSRFNTELSIATHNKSPLMNLSSKFGGDPQDDIVGSVDASHFMGLSMDVGAKVNGIAKLEGDRYSGRSSWVPIAWDSPAIGGPLGEVLQSNGPNSGGNYSGSLANNGGERCLNLIEEESWVHQEGAHVSSPAKDSHSHSPSLASPTGVLQMKASFASYSDSSSSASSPRSALKLDSANLGI